MSKEGGSAAYVFAAQEVEVQVHPGPQQISGQGECADVYSRWVRHMLDAYPNFHVDITARVAELGRQPRAARELIVAHPDRVLFGIDEFPPERADYAIYFRFHETADEGFAHSTEEVPMMGRWTISGLDLPDDVLRRVYAENASRIAPGIAG